VPRETVSWYQAVAFCRWLSDKLGYLVRLPTEFEWQQAATGGDTRRVYPWGKEWDASRCNSADKGLQRTSTVGLYPHGTWPCGPLDMAGNVMEWCLSIYNRPTHNQIDNSSDYRVLRGGPWCGMPDLCQTTYRVGGLPDWSDATVGFRVLRPPSDGH
jgi:formylglycine-generating enzyme required for sulfatase activity